MAKLQVISSGFGCRIELRPGTVRMGRSPDNDFTFEHITVSSHHCELMVSIATVMVQDLNSTNGTYIDGQRIDRAPLREGQTLRLGQLEILCEGVLPAVSVPSLAPIDPAAGIDLGEGHFPCVNHPREVATDRCTGCHRAFCATCVHVVRMVGKAAHRLCPMCSHPVEALVAAAAPQKRSILKTLQKTLRLFGDKSSPKPRRRRR